MIRVNTLIFNIRLPPAGVGCRRLFPLEARIRPVKVKL